MRAFGDNYLAIKALQRFAEFNIRNDDLSTLVWLDDESVVPRPTNEQILAKAAEMRAARNDQIYKDKRKPDYPDLNQFADAIYWMQKGDRSFMDKWLADCDEVKARYPKP